MTQTLLVLLFQATVYLILAPGVVGLLHWFKARLQGRRGADLWQPYRDLLKLMFRKRPNIPESASQVFLIAPPVIFVCYLLLGFFLPTFFIGDPGVSPMPWRSLSIDFIFVIYLLGLAKFIAALAAFDAGAPFGSMSSGRQFYLHLLAEPALMIATYALTLTRSSSNIDQLIGYNLHQNILLTLTNPAMVLILLALSTVFLAESGRLPFDNPHTHLELTMIEPGTFLEYSGRSLALIEWANWLKLTFFLSLLASLAWPWGMATHLTRPALAIALLIYLVKIIGLTFLLAVWELARVKLRLRRAFSPLLAALGFALIAVVYTVATNYL